jgi:hypothetical protein
MPHNDWTSEEVHMKAEIPAKNSLLEYLHQVKDLCASVIEYTSHTVTFILRTVMVFH